MEMVLTFWIFNAGLLIPANYKAEHGEIKDMIRKLSHGSNTI